ncbi:MAG: isoprenylcysteine carboxylmethyltransferase family protein [Phycisphaeraceae bacterium]|nr:isoprenylcysteine carboxylmethyltransferase family protein [Phycisphaeraceae bacterium]
MRAQPQERTGAAPSTHSPSGGRAAGSGSRIGILAFGLLAYAAFFATICYAIGFVTGIIVPKTIDSGAAGALAPSLLINGAMLVAFVVQHTIMARPRFKRWVTRFIPHAMERSLFVMLASLILAGTFWLWRPLPEVVWSVSDPILANGLLGLSLLGWAIVFGSTFLISHFDLFGVRQVVTNAMGGEYRPVSFRLVGLYKIVRHPLMLGFLIAFWATPHMTVGHLFFSIMTTAYILFGTAIEERDLVAAFGDRYLEYRRNVRGLIPLPRFNTSSKGAA